MSEAVSSAVASRSILADLVTLTKPRIISLLLVTTIAPMFITPAGMPSLALIGWVTRPIPSGRMPASAALAFGISLGAIAFTIFWTMVNPLAAWLALAGLLFYVFIYTMWLKRSSPQNIVIGGAAGAFPPLVGWAA